MQRTVEAVEGYLRTKVANFNSSASHIVLYACKQRRIILKQVLIQRQQRRLN